MYIDRYIAVGLDVWLAGHFFVLLQSCKHPLGKTKPANTNKILHSRQHHLDILLHGRQSDTSLMYIYIYMGFCV